MIKKSTLIISLLVFCHLSQSHATILFYKDFHALVTESQGIIKGTVRDVESYRDENGEIFSIVTIEELDILHGRYTQDALTMYMKGGQVEGEILEIVGSPQFHPEEKVILFLSGNEKAMVPIVGWTQGVFRIVRDKDTEKEIITDYHGNRILGIEGSKVIRESRYPTEEQIFDVEMGGIISDFDREADSGQDGRGRFYSPAVKGAAGPGENEDGTEAEGEADTMKKVPMAVRDFVRTIVKKIETDGLRSVPTIRSVDMEEMGRPTEGLDAAPKDSSQERFTPRIMDTEIEQEPFLPKPHPQKPLPDRKQR